MKLYDHDYFLKIKKQKTINLIILLALIFVFLSTEGLLIYFNSELTYMSDTSDVLKFIMIFSAIVFCLIISLFYHIKYLTVKRYFIVLSRILSGQREIIQFTVLKFNKEIMTRDKIDCCTLLGLVWSENANDYVERKVFLDAEFKNLNFEKGQMLNLLLSSSFILEYEDLNSEEK